jgi:hypothetical protein
MLRFFRALLPSWRFFDRAAPSPQLFVRHGSPLGDWQPFTGGPRPALTPLFAPSANLHLAYCAVVERFVQELGDLDLEEAAPADGVERDPRVTQLVSYEVVTRIARTMVPSGARFQWKVVVPDEGDYIVSLEIAPALESNGAG